GWGFALIALIIGGCIYFLSTSNFNLGIDLRGGTELTYSLDLSRFSVEQGGPSPAEQVKTVIANRLDIYGLKEISIAVQGDDRLVIQLPGADTQEVENLRRLIEQTGHLEFRLVAPDSEQNDLKIKEVQDEETKFKELESAWLARKKAFEQKAL